MWNLIAGPIISGITGYFKDKAAIKKAKVEGEINAIQQASQNAADWEKIHAKGSQSSWKDEFWTIIFAVPLVLGFIPGAQEHVTAGFNSFADMPEWYQYTLVTMVLASFGIRITDRIKKGLGK